MGICVHLAVVEDRVSEAAWREIYRKARRVAELWRPRPLSSGWRQIGAVRVVEYGLEIETAEGLRIVGDAETRTTGESFELPARLGRAAPERDRVRPPAMPDDDVLVAVARGLAAETAGYRPWCDLFGAKTQGLPYHGLVVALGLLVEHSLPGAAVLYGDLSAHDCEQARRGVGAILGIELEPAVVVNAERMRRRLTGAVTTAVLDQTIRELGPTDPYLVAIAGDLLGRLRSSPAARVRHELEHVVRSCPDPGRLAAGTRLLLKTLVEAIRSAMVRGELRARADQWGAPRMREAIAHRTLESGMRLTSMAWDAIESAELDELAFVYGATCIDTTGFDLHHAVRALLENRALRRV